MVKKLLVAGVLCALIVGLWAFQPWRLWTSSEVDEALPSSATVAVETEDQPEPAESSGPSESSAPAEPAASAKPVKDRTLATGRFAAAEHATSGKVRIIELADGRRIVRVEDLATSDGPDLQVWISDQPSGGEWGSYDDGRYVRLGKLKATQGNQNYEIPKAANLTGLQSVVIWCDRFNVAFGTAPVSA